MSRTALSAVLLVSLALGGCGRHAVVEPGGDALNATVAPLEAAAPVEIAPACAALEPPEPAPDGPLSDDEAIAEAQRERARHGLPSDEATVRRIIAESKAEDWPFGFPHTDAEFDELFERNPPDGLIEGIREWVEAEEIESFAGMWVDLADGTLMVAFAEDASTHADEVRERFGEELRVAAVENTYDDLLALHEEIGSRFGDGGVPRLDETDWRPAPGTIVGNALDTRLNRVSIVVVDGDEGRLAELTAQYGAGRICFEFADPLPAPMDPDGPLRPLAKAQGWRFELDAEPDIFMRSGWLIEIAFDRDTAQRAWEDNVPDDLARVTDWLDPFEPGIYGAVADVDFERQAVIVWSAGESGSCPGWLADIDVSGGEVQLEMGSTEIYGCTADYSPYRMVLAVDLDRLPSPDDLPLDEGRVVAYPVEG